MSNGQTNRLSEQQKTSGGQRGIFDKDAQSHEFSVTEATDKVFDIIKKAHPLLKFRHRTEILKKEINTELNKIDSRLGKTLYVQNSKIKPDGGIIEVEDNEGKWRIILVVEAKYQGKDVENILAGKKVGKNKDQDLMVAGNAIERVHKNINEIRNLMIKENHFPYVVFLQGSNFSTKTIELFAPNGRSVKIKHDSGEMNRIDRVTAANYSMDINQNHCENIFIKKDESSYIMLQAASIYAQCEPWKENEMIKIMLDIAETSLLILSKKLGKTSLHL